MGKIGRIVQSQTCYHKVVLIKSDNYYFLIFSIEIDHIDYYSCNRHLILSFRLRSEFSIKELLLRIVQSKTCYQNAVLLKSDNCKYSRRIGESEKSEETFNQRPITIREFC